MDCLARSRLTSLRVLLQSFQLFAKTLRSQLTRARTTDKALPCGGSHPLTHMKKEVRTKVQPLFKSGQGWIRTTVHSREQIYSLSPLATRPPTLIKFHFLTKKLPLTRLELVTSPLPRECSTSEPQGQAIVPRTILLSKKAGNRNRTYNLRFTKPLLYR